MRTVDEVAGPAEPPVEGERIPRGQVGFVRIEHQVAGLEIRPISAGVLPGQEQAQFVAVGRMLRSHHRSIAAGALAVEEVNARGFSVNRTRRPALSPASAPCPRRLSGVP